MRFDAARADQTRSPPARSLRLTLYIALLCCSQTVSPNLALAELPPRMVGESPVDVERAVRDGELTASAAPARVETPRLFLACPLKCFDSYVRQELSYFDFVRDPHLATYTLVVVRQPAGNGGERFTVRIEQRVRSTLFEPLAVHSFLAPPGAPAHAVRERLLQVLLRLLLRELADTADGEAFVLRLAPRDGGKLSTLHDPWHYWVLAPELGGGGEGGSGYYYAELAAAMTVRRITEPSKFRLRGVYARDLSGFRLEDGRRVRGDVHKWETRAIYAQSIKRHGALGGVSTARGSEYENLALHLHGGPVVELNVFPYTDNATRQLRFAYQAGAWANWYLERNADDTTREVRPYHALSLITDVNLAWGSVQWMGQANMFVDDPSLYRISTGAVLSLRLFEGFAISLEGKAAYVRDQINVRGRAITDLELLLWTAQQPTRYQWEMEFALTYTFGSVHNTIVNPRFARVDLDEE